MIPAMESFNIMKLNLVFCILLVVFAVVPDFAQLPSVGGRVEDSVKASVAGATVILRNRKTGAELIAATDAEGRFSFNGAGDPAQYEVLVSAKGFGRFVKQLGSGDANVVLTVTPGPVSEEVTVTATRTQVLTSETAVPVSVVGREEIDRKAVNTISDIFRTLPGTSTVNEG